jgi:hypothetical protein
MDNIRLAFCLICSHNEYDGAVRSLSLHRLFLISSNSKAGFMEGLIEGRIVHFVLPDGSSKGEHRPAIIVKNWNIPSAPNMVNLLVFTDCLNDVDPRDPQTASYGSGVVWITSVHYSEDKEPRTWHWIERS